MKENNRKLNILSFVLIVVSLGYGIFSPILPFYIESMGASGTVLGLLNASYAVMRLIFGPIWGSISDRIGRKRVLLIGIFGFGLTMVWFGLANSLWMLFAARILAGILSSATAPTTMAYISDQTPEGELSKGFGRLSAAGGVGGILGPILGGMVAKKDLAAPFFIAAGLAAVSFFMATLFLPDSKPMGQFQIGKEKILDFENWKNALRGKAAKYFLLTFLSTSGLYIFSNIFGLYGLDRFGYGTQQVGMVYMILAAISMLSVAMFAGPASKKFGDDGVIRYGLICASVCFVLLPIVKRLAGIISLTGVMGAAVSLENTSLISMISKNSRSQQGMTMGLSNSFVSLGRIAGPLVGGALYDIDIAIPLYGAAFLMFIAFLLSIKTEIKVNG